MSLSRDVIGRFFRSQSDFDELLKNIRELPAQSPGDLEFVSKSLDAMRRVNKLTNAQYDELVAALAKVQSLEKEDLEDDATRVLSLDDDATVVQSVDEETGQPIDDEATRLLDDGEDDSTRVMTAEEQRAQGVSFSSGDFSNRNPTGSNSSYSSRSQSSYSSSSSSSRYSRGSGRSGSWSRMQYNEGRAIPGVGDVIRDRFVLEEMVGRGGMGLVFRALDLNRQEAQDREPYVALKILSEEFKKHPDSMQALQREARKSQKLAHPNIVNVHDFDRDGGTVFMTMELLDGDPLDKIIKRWEKDPVSTEDAFKYIRQMAAGLAYAHDRRIVHSDFKPNNVFLTSTGIVKILDLGIAQAATNIGQAEGDETLFDARSLGALTPAYASREMLLGIEPQFSDDIYALGCTAYELLSGRHPFNKTPADKALQKGMVPQPLRHISRNQWRAIASALALERENRVETVDEFLDQLDATWGRKWGLYIATGAAVATIVVAVGLSIPDYLENQELKSLNVELDSSEPARVQQALAEVALLELDQQRSVLSRSSNAMLRYFERQANTFFAPESGRYDYPGADDVFKQALLLYSHNDAVVQVIQGRLAQFVAARKQLLNNLDAQFTDDLAAFEGGGYGAAAQLFEVIRKVEQVDPSHPLISDGRLPPAFASVARNAVDGGDYEQARALLSGILERFPDDAGLREELARADLEERRVTQAVEVFLLEAEVARLRADISSVDELPTLGVASGKLAEIDPGNSELELAREQATTLVRQVVDGLLANYRFDEAREILDKSAPYMNVGGIESLTGAIVASRTDRQETLDGLMNDLRNATSEGNIGDRSAAAAALAALEAERVGAPMLNQARAILFEAYIQKSNMLRSTKDWDKALAIVAEAGDYAASEDDRQRLQAVVLQIDRARVDQQLALEASERERMEEERLTEVGRLTDEFNATIDSGSFGAGEIAVALGTIGQLAAIDPANDIVINGRESIAEKLVERAVALRNAQQYDAARQVVLDGISVLPASERLAGELRQIATLEQRARTLAREERVTRLRSELDDLLVSPAFSEEWNRRLRASLEDLEGAGALTEADSSALRSQIAEVFADGAETARLEGSFAQARLRIDDGRSYKSDYPRWTSELALIDQGEAQLVERQEAQARFARIDGLKQTLTTQADALDVKAAEGTLDQLRLLAPEDPFVTGNAPQALANAYLALAKTALDQKAFSRAEGLTTKGLSFVPSSQSLKNLSNQARRGLLKEQVIVALSSLRSGAAQEVGDKLTTLRGLSGDVYTSDVTDITIELARRFKERAQTDPKQAKALLDAALAFFPGNRALTGVDVDAMQSQKVAAMLGAAQQAEARGQLLSTDGSGAIATYRSILEVVSNEPKARGALDRIRKEARQSIEAGLASYDFERVRSNLQILVEVGVPGSEKDQILARLETLESERAAFDRYLLDARAAINAMPVALEDLQTALDARNQAALLFVEDAELSLLTASLVDRWHGRIAELIALGDLDQADALLQAAVGPFQSDARFSAQAEEIQQIRAESEDEDVIYLPSF